MSEARWLNLELVDSTGAPLSSRDYTLSFDDGPPQTGQLDADGRLSVPAPAGARRASLLIATRRLDLVLEGMAPADSVAGAQERLNQLNYFSGPVDGELGPMTAAALRGFQVQHGLGATGALDDDTAAVLRDQHGS